MKLKNKVVVITGASQGLGEELACQIAKQGAKIGLLARTEELLKKVKQRIIKGGGRAEYFVCDIRDLKQIKKAVEEIKIKFKKIDILVNNAGVWTDENLEKKRPELRQNAFNTNALGHINFTYEVLPILKRQKRAHILNVISAAGASDIPSGNNTLWKTYGASKWAMVGFSKTLRNSLKNTKIKVTQYLPGGFESNLYENAGRPNPHNQPWMMKTKDVAKIIVFALTRPDDVHVEKIVVSKMM